MQLKPWTEVAIPHSDVLKGTFQDAEFAADLSRVREGRAQPEYGEPVQYFERTFITEGMRLLLDGVVRRLNGKGGDPVVQLQTAFGGGKTHTMLAVYHLACGQQPADSLRGIPKILDVAGITELPRAKVAVIDGNRIAPSQPRQRGEIRINCLWGEVAWQLGGADGYAMVAGSDASGTSPGKEVLVALLEKFAPVVVLMDETVAYLRQFQEGQSYVAGTFDSNLSFVQALTEAMTAVPSAVLLASLPESHAEIGGAMGKKALAALEKYFGRVQALWKPVAAEEAFEIVRRRLFNPITDRSGMEEVCRAFADCYARQADQFPTETQEPDYLRRLCNSYPIHPEVFNRLYEDWSSLDGFQRTRGVLKFMAKVIFRLWKDGNRDLMILPGALPLYDHDVKNESIYYLPQGWDPVVERDIDGERAQTTAIDTQDPRLGAVQAARRTARTIFLGSAPSVPGQMVRGIDAKRIALGTAQPGSTVSVFQDALQRLSDRLHYLNMADGRYWFDVRPNLRREMEERKRRFTNKDDIYPEIRSRLSKMIGKGCFGGTHIFTPSGDIPDDFELHLCVLTPDAPHSINSNLSTKAAVNILQKRGDQPRQHQNRLIFLAADADSLGRLRDQVRSYLSWKSIRNDIEAMKLNLDMLQINQVRQFVDKAASGLNRMISECYRWLLCPVQSMTTSRTPDPLTWETLALNGSDKSMVAKIEDKLLAEEIIINQWSPIHLNQILKTWFWKPNCNDIGTFVVWKSMCDYLYMPRLTDAAVFQQAVNQGVESGDYFGYADGKEDNVYRGLRLGVPVYAVIDQSSLIVRLQTAKAEAERQNEGRQDSTKGSQDTHPTGDPNLQPDGENKGSTQNTLKKRFYGTVRLDPHTGRIEYDQIHEEIIALLASKPGNVIILRLDIEATSPHGFDENIQRAIRENSNTLQFDDAEFE